MNYICHNHSFPLSVRQLRKLKRFTSRGSIVSHLTTHENCKTNDLLTQAGRFSDFERPTSEIFVPSVERSSRFFNQIHHKETVMKDMVTKNQTHSSFSSSNSYQGKSTPVATSDRHSPSLFGTDLLPSSQNFTQFQDKTST